MDKEIMKDILESVQGQPSLSGLNIAPPTPTTRPANPIVPKKKVEEWDETFTRLEKKIDGIIIDGDTREQLLIGLADRLEAGLASQLLATANIRSLTRQLMVRDIIVILLVISILLIVGFNTSQLWNWN